MVTVFCAVFCAGGIGTGFLAVAVGCTAGAGALATLATGLAVAVVVVAVFATGTGVAVLVELARVGWVVVPLTVDAGVIPEAEVVEAVPPLVAAGAQGALLDVVGAAGAAVFFFPKSDPKLEIAAAAFETAALVPAGA